MRATAEGWVIVRDKDSLRCDNGLAVNVYRTKREAITSQATGGHWDASWWRNIQKSGWRAVRVRASLSVREIE
jgi:hypothetical protein